MMSTNPNNDLNFIIEVNRHSGRFCDRFTDFLNDFPQINNQFWPLCHRYDAAKFSDNLARTPTQIVQDTFNDAKIEELLQRDSTLREKINSILTEMAHIFDIRFARIPYLLIFQAMQFSYEHIYVDFCLGNNDQVSLPQALNKLVTKKRILFLPNHISYTDWLGLNVLKFAYNLPIGTLPSGRNLLALGAFSHLIRWAGGFFIRRNFNWDPLYSAVFSAYVRSQLIGGEHPLGCFLEGTRTRTGKSYFPKIGYLRTIVDAVLAGTIDDIAMVPISHSYDRILEDDLYAKELASGYSKPIENPCNLLRGFSRIMAQSNGCAYLRFGEPISLREYLARLKLSRSTSMHKNKNNNGSDISLNEEAERNEIVLEIAERVIVEQNRNLIISPFTFAAIIFLDNNVQSEFNSNYESSLFNLGLRTFEFDQITMNVASLALLVPTNLTIAVNGLGIKEDFRQLLAVHARLVQIVEADSPETSSMLTVDFDSPLIVTQLQIYANQAMQLLINHAVYIYTRGDSQRFRSIRRLLKREFICCLSDIESMFKQARNSLCNNCEIQGQQKLTPVALSALQTQVYRYLVLYRNLIHWFESKFTITTVIKTTLKSLKSEAVDALKFNVILVNNVFALLHDYGCVLETISSTDTIQIDRCALHNLQSEFDYQTSEFEKL